ncbi:E3 ubiquitin-protein ligase TRIM50 [Strongylocentrotus purpuratus]|uniref:Uncharacterized protein n=1 Tax=Strongylocentrotus purpuratus TaxID=7668 RepID=A0A7M7T290_STRPU|nr:E3 ubiquitin-protein ligase TRIM50 [Strongylocentrotus purpuratus]|eukprot:XP_011683843.1 PREDICTED: E3 ubiquitin-protein ligase TRIM50-like [Strongylocentrotus purpuratus]
MAARSKEEKLQCFNCPMCLDVLKNATLLSCGHSFCRGCLEAYDKQLKDLNHIVCPVCRKTTKLDQERVAGLTPNFLAKGLEDILKVDGSAQNQENDLSKFCPLHSHVYKDIYCQPCSEFICLTCYIDSHQGHKIKKQEELEKELKTMRDALLEKSMTKKTHFEHCLSEATLQRDVLSSHLSGLEGEVRIAFANKVATLQQNEEELLEKIGNIRELLSGHWENCICHCTEVISRISNSVKLLTHHASKPLDHDMIKAVHLTCADLEDSLKEATLEESTKHVKDIQNNVQFRPAGDELLALGCIHLGDNDIEASRIINKTDDAGVSEEAGVPPASSLETGNAMQHMKTTGRRRRKNRGRRKKQAGSEALLNNSMSTCIVRTRAFPLGTGRLFGLAALSKDAVVLGYAMDRKGCYRFTLSGDEDQYLGSEVGDVYDVALLSGGRTIVSKQGDEFFVYNTVSGSSSGKRYACKQSGGFVRVCTDQHDNIYAVNIKPEICIFHGSNPNPQRVVPTGDIRPKQICVTTTGIMITSTGDITPSTVTVFDRDGRVGTSIVATHDDEFVYATVDSLDRVLVATVVNYSDVLRLTRYRLQGIRLVEEVRFQYQQLTLTWPIQSSMLLSSLFYIVSLTPTMVAIATRHDLIFIQLGI